MQPANKPQKVTSWQLIGAQLAHCRKQARLSQEALAERVSMHVDSIASVEQGRRALKLDLAEQLDELLDTRGVLAVAVKKVPKKEKLPAFVQDFVEYEALALTLLSYENQVVPGLLQTKAYARGLFNCLYPPIDADQVEDWVAGRLDRQKLLDRKKPTPMLNFILEESILHRHIGGREAMQEQIRHLRRCAELPFLGLQIMPLSRAHHASLAGPMVLLETHEHEHLAYLEAHYVGLLIDDPDQVSLYQQKYGMLRSQALNPEESMSLLDDLAGAS